MEVRTLTTMREIADAAALIERWYGTASGVPTNMMRALQHAGGYVAAAFDGARVVGASVAFRGVVEGRPVLHSHITCAAVPGQGVGMALKSHQRRWCAVEGIDAITWTFDPLVARNGWFNLAKLGAVGRSYLPDHYGAMDDPINSGEATDRILVWWAVEGAPRPARPTGGVVPLLAIDDLDRPDPTGHEVDGRARAYAVRVPEDIEGLRAVTPMRAREWRTAVREAMGAAMALGYQATAIERDGTYLLTRPPGDAA